MRTDPQPDLSDLDVYRDVQDGCRLIVESISEDLGMVYGRREFVKDMGGFGHWSARLPNFRQFYAKERQ